MCTICRLYSKAVYLLVKTLNKWPFFYWICFMYCTNDRKNCTVTAERSHNNLKCRRDVASLPSQSLFTPLSPRPTWRGVPYPHNKKIKWKENLGMILILCKQVIWLHILQIHFHMDFQLKTVSRLHICINNAKKMIFFTIP